MTMPPAVTTRSVPEQHIQPPAWQVVAEQAVFKIDPEVFAVRVDHVPLLDGLKIEAFSDDRHGTSLVW